MAHEANDLLKAPATANRRRDWIARSQVILAVFAVLGVFGFWVAEWLVHREARYTPGGMASVHSMWDANCSACHETSRPMAAGNWFAVATGQSHVADSACQKCHKGPPHHSVQIESEVAGCTSCHREHQGRPGRLLNVPDSQCTSCHQNLADHINEAGITRALKMPQYGNVTRFAEGEHPDFKKADPGTIAFNHALHLSPGMSTPAEGKGFTLEQIDEPLRNNYRNKGETDKSPVQLHCGTCHRTEAWGFVTQKDQLDGLPFNPLRPAQGTGRLMAPIVYEQHCQACHPLTVDRTLPGDPKSDLYRLRHRMQPKAMIDQLAGHYTHLWLKGRWTPTLAPELPTLPGKLPIPKKVGDLAETMALDSVKSLLLEEHPKTLSQKVLGPTTCQKCHTSLSPDLGVRQTVPPANIPTVWFEHARFDHAAHRAVECRNCHEAAFPDAVNASTKNTDVILPTMKMCVQCHAPRTDTSGGVRFDCVTCHSYHYGDFPLQGLGSKARGPGEGTTTIEEFQQGR